jgi:hypothetical protein
MISPDILTTALTVAGVGCARRDETKQQPSADRVPMLSLAWISAVAARMTSCDGTKSWPTLSEAGAGISRFEDRRTCSSLPHTSAPHAPRWH